MFYGYERKKTKHTKKSSKIKYVTFCISPTFVVIGGNASLLVWDLRVGGSLLIGFFKFLACTTHVKPSQLYNNVSHTYSWIIELTIQMHLNWKHEVGKKNKTWYLLLQHNQICTWLTLGISWTTVCSMWIGAPTKTSWTCQVDHNQHNKVWAATLNKKFNTHLNWSTPKI